MRWLDGVVNVIIHHELVVFHADTYFYQDLVPRQNLAEITRS